MAQAQITQHQHIPEMKRRLTLAEFLLLPSEQPVEVVNGKVVMLSPNQRPSVRVARNLYDSLRDSMKGKNLGELSIEATYILDGDKRSNWVEGSRQPDVSFVAQERIAAHDAEYGADGPWWLAPDLAVEVVSPTDSYTDVNQKIKDYLRYGVRLIWIIDPQARTVWVITPDIPHGHTLNDTETLSGEPALPGWSMPVAELLDGRPE
jgi:Uma2 family endonuclease